MKIQKFLKSLLKKLALLDTRESKDMIGQPEKIIGNQLQIFGSRLEITGLIF
jgi:hypothetical protein